MLSSSRVADWRLPPLGARRSIAPAVPGACRAALATFLSWLVCHILLMIP
jgi:hypothetical protein